ncbi:MAG: hypothetical protein M0Z66_09395 [Thermaerobacter sp.]|nr:hypothetical protein [Thermaerobacter sp.]
MRRVLIAAIYALFLLAACGAPKSPRPLLRLGLLGEPLGAAPALLAQDSLPLPLGLRRGAAARTAPYLIAPSSMLPQLAGEGWIALGAACASPPDTLLWHATGLFSWQDLAKQGLYLAPGADAPALGAAIARYRGVLSPLPEPISQVGGVAGFEADPTGFLLAPEPIASSLLANGQAELAQPLPDELGPYPSCLLLARRTTLQADPLLSLQMVRALDLGLWRLSTEDPGQLALALRPLVPGVSPSSLLRTVLTARQKGIFTSALNLSGSALMNLEGEFARGRFPQGAVDDQFARRALRDPFPH